jgi:S-adenosylmethionine decarboxylase
VPNQNGKLAACHCDEAYAIIGRMSSGLEWLIDAAGCDRAGLCNLKMLRAVCDEIIADLALRVVGRPIWHQFPDLSSSTGPGGVTGLYLLSESHLTCHTFPELGLATFNLYCCRPHRHWDWQTRLAERLGATQVAVRCLPRGVESSGHAEGEHLLALSGREPA